MARLSDVELERLKRDVSLVRLCEAKGVALKRHGPDNLLGRCPFHEDKTPSFVVSPSKNVWHCLGACRAGGSVIDFVMKAEGVSFRHAVELLRNDVPLSPSKAGEVKTSTVRRLTSPVTADADDAKVLAEVVEYYHQTLKASPEALAYLEKRGLKDEGLIAHFKLGYANRTLGLHLPESNRASGEKLRGRLQALGVYRESGHEHLAGSLVVPIHSETGKVVGLYGRKVTPNLRPGTPQHLYLPGPHRAAFNSVSLVSAGGTAIVCEALLDALTFWAAGFRNVISAYGVEGFTDAHLDALVRHQVRDVFIAYDRDDAGDAAAEALAKRLEAEGLDCYRVQFPRGMDANEYALKVTPASKSLGVALRRATFMGPGAPRRRPTLSPLAALVDDADAGAPSEAVPDGQEEGRRVAVTTSAKDATAVAPTEAVPVALDTSVVAPSVLVDATAVAAAAPVAMIHPAEEVPAPASSSSNTEAAPAAPTPVAAPTPPTPATTTPPATAVRAPAPATTTAPAATTTPAPALQSTTEDEATIHFGPRRYRLRGLAKPHPPDSLRLNVLLGHHDAFHVDTFDMYSAKARFAFVVAAAAECGVDANLVKRDVGYLLLEVEALLDKRREEAQGPKVPTLTEEERDAAMALLRTPNLLTRILEDFTRCGVVGEETNKLVGYLAAVSRKLEEPLAVLIQSSSAAGKSSLMEAVLAFVPEEEKTKYSAMTGQSLFYMGDVSLRHKVLAVVEEEGASRAAYALKLLQSEGELTIASTGKDPHTGRLVTHEYHVEGPTQLFLTTTATHIDEELLNRCLVLTVDEERAQTSAIHERQRRKRTLEGRLEKRERDATLKLHQDAQRLLRPLAVVNPYAAQLTFPDAVTRTRRDFPKYLTLIEAIALLHQYQRPVKTAQARTGPVEYVEVTPEDIATANRLASSVLGRTLDELPPQTRRLLAHLEAYVAARAAAEGTLAVEVHFTRRQLREALKWGDTQLKVHLSRLVDMELLATLRPVHGGFMYSLRTHETAMPTMGLATTDALSVVPTTPSVPVPAPTTAGSAPTPTTTTEGRSALETVGRGAVGGQSGWGPTASPAEKPSRLLSLAASSPAVGPGAKAHSARAVASVVHEGVVATGETR